MASLNKVMLIGNLGRDPEINYLPSGDAVASLALATTEKWKDKDGNAQERTEWHRVSFFGRQAEIAGEYLKKGSQIYVEGSLTTRKWQDKDGNDRYTTEIRGDRMQMLGGRAGGGGEQQGGADQPRQEPRQGQSRGQSQEPRQQRQPAGSGNRQSRPAPSFDDFEDDIPF